jgi:hypothetical protein
MYTGNKKDLSLFRENEGSHHLLRQDLNCSVYFVRCVEVSAREMADMESREKT